MKANLYAFVVCCTMSTCTGIIKSRTWEEDASGQIIVKSQSEVHWSLPRLFSTPQGTCFKSSRFSFMDLEWRLNVCLHDYGNGESLRLGLEVVHSPSNQSIKFRMGIKGDDGSEVSGIQEYKFEYDHDVADVFFLMGRNTPYFRQQLAPREEVTFFCSFLSTYSESETYQDRPSKGADKVIESFEHLFLSGDHHDMIIKVQDQEIRAHRLIIFVRCPALALMFCPDTIEKSTIFITIEDCDPEAFREFLSFLYSGKLKNVTDENVIKLYNIADKYQVDEVKSECVEFMMRNMSDETFCDFISLAFKHSEIDLLNFATNYFVVNVKTIILSAKWQSFHKEYPVESHALYVKAII